MCEVAYPLAVKTLAPDGVALMRVDATTEFKGSEVIDGYLHHTGAAACLVSILNGDEKKQLQEDMPTYVWRKDSVVASLIEVGRFVSRHPNSVQPLDPTGPAISGNDESEGSTTIR